MRYITIIMAAALLAGCANGPEWLKPRESSPEASETSVEADQTSAPVPAAKVPPTARTADEFDTSSAADKAEAAKPSSGGTDLGVTIASLGAAGEPGFWMKTPLVKSAGPGRVVYPANGKSVKVDLIPIAGEAGAGSQLSLAALRVIEAPLTGLPEVRVFSLK